MKNRYINNSRAVFAPARLLFVMQLCEVSPHACMPKRDVLSCFALQREAVPRRPVPQTERSRRGDRLTESPDRAER